TLISYWLIRFLLTSSLPQHALLTTSLSLSLPAICFKPVVASLNTFWSNQIFVFFSTIVVRSYSNSCGLVIC
ncbi:unnamed protein product, partial [Hymenolepis diminuta]